MNEEKLKAVWMKVISDAAPLGPQAIKDQMLKAHYDNTEVKSVSVVDLGDYAYKVRIGFAYAYGPGREPRHVEIAVRNPNVESSDWEANLRHIRFMQDSLPGPFKGLPHNCDEFMTRKIIELVRKKTGYWLAVGDIWVHSCDTLDAAIATQMRGEGLHEGMVAFGYLNRSGEIALRKYMEVEGLIPDEPVRVSA